MGVRRAPKPCERRAQTAPELEHFGHQCLRIGRCAAHFLIRDGRLTTRFFFDFDFDFGFDFDFDFDFGFDVGGSGDGAWARICARSSFTC